MKVAYAIAREMKAVIDKDKASGKLLVQVNDWRVRLLRALSFAKRNKKKQDSECCPMCGQRWE